jgi:hypothetical protein
MKCECMQDAVIFASIHGQPVYQDGAIPFQEEASGIVWVSDFSKATTR